MKLMLRWGWGWGGHVNVCWHLRHEVEATLGMGVGWGGVGWGMLTFAGTYVMKLILLLNALDALMEAKVTK